MMCNIFVTSNEKLTFQGVTLYKQESKASAVSLNSPSESLIEEPNLEVPEVARIYREESRIPWWQMGVLGILEAGMLVFLYLKGGAGNY
jgi:hypothetical protein